MSVKLERPEKNIVVLEIEVENEVFKDGMRRSYNKNRGRFNVPGFRKGKAPQAMIERMYGEEVLYEDAINFIIPDKYDQAVLETKIEPVERPKIDIKEVGRDKNFVFTATVTVKPEVFITEYKGVEAEKIIFKIEDKDVQSEIDTVVKRNSRKVTVEGRAVQDKDTVNIDYEGFVDGVPFQGGKAEGHDLVIGSGSFIPGFEEQLIGKNTGDETEINVTFPEEYHSEEVAGKEAVFKVKINQITTTEYPELDDEFAKDVSEFDTLEEYKADIMKKLQKQADSMSKNGTEDNVIKEVLKNTEIDVPDVMIQHTIDRYVNEMTMRLQYQFQGLTMEKYLEYMGRTMEEFREESKERAINELKTSLMLEKIVELENIKTDDQRLDEELKKTAEAYGQDLETFKQRLRDDDIEYYRAEISKQIAVEFLTENAKLTEVERKFREDPKRDSEDEPAIENVEDEKIDSVEE